MVFSLTRTFGALQPYTDLPSRSELERKKSEGQTRAGDRERWQNLLVVSLLLREDSDAEVAILVGLEGGGDEDILPWGQLEAVEDLPEVDEGVRPLPGSGCEEKVLAEVDVGLPC